MSNRYAENIRKIVGIDKNQGALKEVTAKPRIGARRGIGYMDPTSGAPTGVNGEPGLTRLQSDLGGGLDPSGENITTAEELDPNNPQAGINSSSETTDAEDIIDGNVGALSNISAKDCSTGQDVSIDTRHGFSPPDAVEENGTTIRNQWEAADTPPDIIGAELGKFWTVQSTSWTGAVEVGVSPWSMALGLVSKSNTHSGGARIYSFVSLTETSATIYTLTMFDSITSATYEMPIAKADCTVDAEDFAAADAVGPTACTGSIKEQFWPASNTYKLKLSGGQFTTSPYDPNRPAKYTNPVSKVNFCFGAGGSRFGTMEVTKDGGFMLYETVSAGGAATGTAKVYGNDGNLKEATPVSTLDAYRP